MKIKLSSYAMLLTEVKEIPLTKAYAIFKSHGITNVESMSIEDIQSAWKKILRKIHPDLTGTVSDDAQMLNAAMDSIVHFRKNSTSFSSPSEEYTSNVPEWETDKRSGFNQENPPKGNIQYYKKKAWEISGKPSPVDDNKYTFWNWDGYYFRGILTVYTTPEHWFEVSKLLIEWDNFYRSVAVFVADKKDNTLLYLVNHKGQEIKPPMEYGFDSMNNNPGNDHIFTNLLRKAL